MTAARALMVLTENWTLSPRPTLPDLVELAVQAEASGVDGGHRLVDAGTVPFDYTVQPRATP